LLQTTNYDHPTIY
jgi:hypothetical protein